MRHSFSRSSLCLFFLAVAFSTNAQAVDPDRMQAALDVERATGGEQKLNQTIEAMRPALIKLLSQSGALSLTRSAQLVDTVLIPEFRSHSGEMLASRARIFAVHFSAEQLKQVEAFYRSSAGQQLLKDQAAIASETLFAMQPFIRDVQVHARALAEQNARGPEK